MCSGCHRPHQADGGKLLAKPVPDLCFDCHDRGNLSGKAVSHPPVMAGDCMSCHAPHGSSAPRLLSVDIPDLCYKCHKKKEFVDKKTHGPVKIGLCMECHEPHQGNLPRLLHAAVPGLCFKCHRQSKFNLKNGHFPVREGMCLECHDTHASDYYFMLKQKNNEVCRQCHEKIFDEPHVTSLKGDGHTVSGKIDPRRPSRRFTCTSCHNPHSSNWMRLFRYEARQPFELCSHCHKK
jgi:predicted CXXCH cytochrome family protein